MDLFNKFSLKLSNYFKDEEILSKKTVTVDDTLIYLNSQVILWKYDKTVDDEAYNQVLNHRHKKQYMIYNLLDRKIKFQKDFDTIIDFKTPDLPAYTLEFLLSFSVSARNWLSLDQYNVLIIHDDISNVLKIVNYSLKSSLFYLVSFHISLNTQCLQ